LEESDAEVAYDAGKQAKGRKIHALVDSEGLPVRVVVHSAATQRRGWLGARQDPPPLAVARSDLGRWRLQRPVG
jgi:hypothetical protein